MHDPAEELTTTLHVLIIEDSRADAELVIDALRRGSFAVEFEIIDAPEAFRQALGRQAFDVVLSDHNLVTWTGEDALRILQESERDIPFIIITGTLGDERAVAYLKNGATDYVLKDHLCQLAPAVARAIREKAQREENIQLQETRIRILRELRESESRLRTVMQTIPDVIWLKDPQGVYLGCNSPFEQLMGLPSAEIIGKTDYDLLSSDAAEANTRIDQVAIATGQSVTSEQSLTFAANGYTGLFEAIRTPMKDEAGQLVGLVATARDISARSRTEQELRIAACAFEAQEGIMITNAHQVIMRVNRAFTEMTGYSAHDVIGHSPRLLKSNRHDRAFYENMWAQISTQGAWHGEIWNRRKNGEIFPEWLTITAVKNSDGEITHYVGMMLDITARHAAAMEIEHLAFYDLLTQLPNRRLLLDRLRQALLNTRRYNKFGAVYFIDLDNFKMLNDSLGHDIGDALLIEAANRLSTCIRENDSVARLGGDEFVVLVEGLSENAREAVVQAGVIGKKILSTLSGTYNLGGITRHASASIGVAVFSGATATVEEIMKQADIAMYQAKAAGRQALCFFDLTMQADIGARALVEQDLRAGVERGELSVLYQPQVDASNVVIGAEALVRWNHPQRGMVFPNEFIPVAGDTGLIVPIGQWVLESACHQIAAWSGIPALRDICISVNVSAGQFRRDDFVTGVRRALQEAGASPQRLRLELTESLLIANIESTCAKMKMLKDLGVRVSIDDFGTGFSSLFYLTRFPLDEVKIDRSFVHNLPGSGPDAVVVQTILDLGRTMGLTVIAEGVETEPQHQFLRDRGCSAFQGFLFGHPMDVTAFEHSITHNGGATALQSIRY